jgi:spermidine/putrescine transport system ATP-binding protein
MTETQDTGSVHLAGVRKTFGDVVAVDSIDLAVRAGEFISLLGPSGCGKTTTLQMLAGFEDPDAGEILISGRPVRGVPPHKRDVNTVFQAYALFPHMTVAENVAYGLRQKRVAKAELRSRVSDALAMAQISGLASRKPAQLSGGQQQRVALARALVNRPAVLLLDEPLAALDRKLRQEMQLELKLLQAELGTTFVFVTHDQDEALSMSDRIAVMLDGRIEQLADPGTIYDAPASRFVAGFVGLQNFFPGTAHEEGSVLRGASAVLRAGQRSSLPEDAPAVAAVRPECVDVEAARDTGTAEVRENAVRGRIRTVSHLGETTQYLIGVPSSPDLLARVPRHRSSALHEGQEVECTWTRDHVRVFADDGTSPINPTPADEGVLVNTAS